MADLVTPSYDGNTGSWQLPITVPMPLTLEFEAIVDGDSISGAAKVGSFATIPFEGSRVSPLSRSLRPHSAVALGTPRECAVAKTRGKAE